MELDIANIIKGIAFCEISIENERLRLAENPNFDVNQCWNKLDKTKTGKVGIKQLMEFLAQNRIAASERETEILINLKSNIRGVMTKESFFNQILPNSNKDLFDYAINKEEITKQQAKQHFSNDLMVSSYSEREVALLFGEELKFYREIENLRKLFMQNYGTSLNEVYKLIDFKERGRGTISQDIMMEFMKKNNVIFSDDEFKAFCIRTTVDLDQSIQYQELINAFISSEPFNYPAFRRQFDAVEAKNLVFNKSKEFEVSVTPYSFNRIPQKKKIDPLNYHHPISKVYDPYNQGTSSYYCDYGYMQQQDQYKQIYYNPNRDYKFFYNTNGKQGIRNHDNYFSQYYEYLYEREQNEHLFNKFGKRYVFDDDMATLSQGKQVNQQPIISKSPIPNETVKRDIIHIVGSPNSSTMRTKNRWI